MFEVKVQNFLTSLSTETLCYHDGGVSHKPNITLYCDGGLGCCVDVGGGWLTPDLPSPPQSEDPPGLRLGLGEKVEMIAMISEIMIQK